MGNPTAKAERDTRRTQWLVGDWHGLATIENTQRLEDHPNRSEIALYLVAAQMQLGNQAAAQATFKSLQHWGVEQEKLAEMLLSSVATTLSKASALLGDADKMQKWTYQALCFDAAEKELNKILILRLYNQLKDMHLNSVNLEDELIRNINGIQLPKVSNTTFSSKIYWEERYKKGGNSGSGSYGRLAEFKAKIVNKFIKDNGISEVLEFGCGDGNQLSLLDAGFYYGVDISSTIIDKCIEKFKDEAGVIFLTVDDFKSKPFKCDLTLSLDVIYHLVEDDVYHSYMRDIFTFSKRFCIIYSCNEEPHELDAQHMKRRVFVDYVEREFKKWRLLEVVKNKFPTGSTLNAQESSISDFYIFKKID